MELQDADKDKVDSLQKAIRRDYRHNWIIDNLPAASLVPVEGEVSAVFLLVALCLGYRVLLFGELLQG